jgi:hypothetical protein
LPCLNGAMNAKKQSSIKIGVPIIKRALGGNHSDLRRKELVR